MPANTKVAHNDTEYKGEPVDDQLENGPMEKRSCTDPLCCLLFIAFIVGMVAVAAYGISKGNPELVGRGYDYDGKICGYDSGYEDYPLLYFAYPKTGHLTDTVCTSACPTGPGSVSCKTNTLYTSTSNCQNSQTEAQQATDMNSGSPSTNFFVYSSFSFVSRFCLPSSASSAFSEASSTVLNSDLLEQWVSDLRTTWPVIAVSLGVAFVLGLVYMILLRFCSGILTWGAILAFIVGTAILGWRFYKYGKDREDESDSTSSGSTGSGKQTYNSQKIIGYVLWGVAAFTVLAVLCLFSRIRLAIAIMKAASDYVRSTLTVFILPPTTVFVLLLFYVYWAIAAVYLVSSGDPSQISGTPFGTFEFDKTLKRLLIYHLFGLLWFNAFVIACTQFVIASSVCLWYFSQGTGQGASGTIRKSIYRLIRYHLGSIAFGSLILAIIQMIRLILAYLQAQAKKMQGKQGKMISLALGCLQCYVACFERFIKFLNKNAYIQIALTGKNFCFSAKEAFFLILRNPIRFGVVNGIGTIFILFGKVFVASLTALAAFLVITRWDKYSDKIYSPFFPTVVVFIFAYGIAAVFMSVYGLAADTILACFVVDEELSKKKNAPPRHCPESLKSFIDRNKKN